MRLKSVASNFCVVYGGFQARNSFETNFQRLTEHQKSELSHRIMKQVAGAEVHVWVGLHTSCEAHDPDSKPESRIKIFAFLNCVPMNISPFENIDKFLTYFEKYISTPCSFYGNTNRVKRSEQRARLEDNTEITCYISLNETGGDSVPLSTLKSTISSMFRQAITEMGSASLQRVREEIVHPVTHSRDLPLI